MNDQDYYFTTQWQTDERESVEALNRGEGQLFASAAEAIAWLASCERPASAAPREEP